MLQGLAKNGGWSSEVGWWKEGPTPYPFFWKCVKRKGFKSFVLKVCETKGFADAFLRKCINLKALLGSEGSFGSRCSLRTTIPGRMVVLKVCETKGFADVFFRKCINLRALVSSEGCFGSRCSVRTTIPGRMVVLKVCETKGFA